MVNLAGKKLLVLGATISETTLVKRAQELGIYVIVTDYNTDYSLSPAKYIANEVWDISWSDVDQLEKKCREENVQGVTAGYSEFRVDSLIKLCEKLGLPCYATSEQLEVTRDKRKFKECCRENGVPTVKEYASMDEVDEYPVIVKPTDRAGSIGISIAENKKELETACKYAMECSVKKQIIIEKYIDKGTKIDFYYAVENGKISLITTCDTINADNNGYKRVVQSAWLYPSRNVENTIQEVDQSLKRMIQSLEIKYGCIFFSGFVCDNGEINIFESGFRLEGGHQYNYVNLKGPYNYLDLFIIHALTGKTESILSSQIDNDLLAVTINLYAKEGTISQIQGFNEASRISGCCLALLQGRVGEKCDGTHAILKKLALFQFVSHSPACLKKDVDLLYQLFKVYDENGNDMIYDRIETNKITSWWGVKGSNITIKKKDATVSYETIQQLLSLAHKKNIERGLVYATANQTTEKLIEKIGASPCFIAVQNDGMNENLVGTCTLEERKLQYWYVDNKMETLLLLKLVGIHPDWSGKGIGKALIEYCIDYAKKNHYRMIVTDSAEENIAFMKLMASSGFKAVDCVKYASNNFISTVYAKWIYGNCPWSEDMCNQRYDLRRKEIIEQNENRP